MVRGEKGKVVGRRLSWNGCARGGSRARDGLRRREWEWLGKSDHGRGSEAAGREGVNLTSLSPKLFQNIINTLC